MATKTLAEVCNDVICLQGQVAALEIRDDELKAAQCILEDAVNPVAFTPGTFAFMSDQGTAGAAQTAAASLVLGFGLGDPDCLVDGLLFGGGNNYPSGAAATIEANFAAFNAFVTAGRLFPAIGTKDMDTLAGQAMVDKFPLLFTDGATPVAAERNYYHKYFVRGDLDLFVLSSGDDTAEVLREPDGNTVGSVQYQWFINELDTATGRWRVVLVNRAHVTAVNTAPAKFDVDLDWSFESLGIHLMLVGFSLANQHIRANGLNIFDISAVVQTPETVDITGTLYGDTTGAFTVFQDVTGPGNTGLPAVAKIIAEKNKLTVEIYEVATGTILNTFVV